MSKLSVMQEALKVGEHHPDEFEQLKKRVATLEESVRYLLERVVYIGK